MQQFCAQTNAPAPHAVRSPRECVHHLEQLPIDLFRFRECGLERSLADDVASHSEQNSMFARVRPDRRRHAQPAREHSIPDRRIPTALDVTEDRDPGVGCVRTAPKVS